VPITSPVKKLRNLPFCCPITGKEEDIMKRSKRLAAWDYVGQDLGHLAGYWRMDSSENQERLRERLQRLYEAPLPSEAIYDIAIALRLAWQIGREER
jgi:hypothetical protein